MDMMKIGRYIAGKRKDLGLTQRQVAEQLGMSDKSVSKWERGICLPDVSVYADLCSILGITLNELLAGEDILSENIIEKSEENILGVATDSKAKQKKLKGIICCLLVVSILAIGSIGGMVFRRNLPQNYIVPAEENSTELKTAQLLSGADGAYLFHYVTTDAFTSLRLHMYEYQAGELVDEDASEISFEGFGSPQQGTILFVPDFENYVVKLILADDSSKLSTEIPILTDVEGREYYGRSARRIDQKLDIQYNSEQGLLTLIYDNDELRGIGPLDVMSGNTEALRDNDFVYYFSVEFCKA